MISEECSSLVSQSFRNMFSFLRCKDYTGKSPVSGEQVAPSEKAVLTRRARGRRKNCMSPVKLDPMYAL